MLVPFPPLTMCRWARLCCATLVFFVATMSEPAAAQEPQTTTVFHHVLVFTAEPDHPYAEAVAIRGDRIIAVGSREAVERVAGSGAREIDVQGKFLMPGMIDAHAHPIDGGVTLIQANFPDTADSVPKLVEFVSGQLDNKISRLGDTLMVSGIDIGYWSHAEAIDAALSSGVFARQPIVLLGSDGHTAWANGLARKRAGITARYIRHLKSGERRFFGFDAAFRPNGFVVDEGKTKLDKSLPPPSPAVMLEAGQDAVHYMNGLGITAWLDAAVSGVVGGATPASVEEPGVLPVYKALAERGELTAHVVAYPVVNPDVGNRQIDVVEALKAKFGGIPNLTIPGLKVFADGVVENSVTYGRSHQAVHRHRAACGAAVHAGKNECSRERGVPPRADGTHSCDRRPSGKGFTGRVRGSPQGESDHPVADGHHTRAVCRSRGHPAIRIPSCDRCAATIVGGRGPQHQ
jgi:predicted amidohydrolase YtcJ